MASKNCSWGVRSKCPENTTGKIYVSKTYNDANGKSRFTSIDATNTRGFTPLSPNDADPVLKNLEYVVQTDGQITFFQKRPDGSRFPLGDSIQDIVDNRLVFPLGSVSGATGAKIMRSLNYNLTETAKNRNITAPGVAQRPSNPDPQGGTPDDSTDADGDSKPDDPPKTFEAGTPNGKIGLTETEQKTKFSPSVGLRYPEGLSSYQDRIQITALALMERTGATKNPDPTPPSTAPASGASSGTAGPPSQQKPGTPTPTAKPAPAAAPQKPGEKPTAGQPTQTEDQKTEQEQTNPPANLNFTFGDINYKKIDEPVLIAIQAPISDQNGVEWGSGGATAIEAAAYDAAIQVTSGELSEAARSIFNTLKDVSTEQGQRIRRYLSGEAAGISNILARTDNIVLNPNLELLFSGPQLRTFTLTFKMSARNATESTQIKKIINYFKYHMAVRDDDASEKGASKSLFLRAPHAFEVKYILGKTKEESDAKEHPSISRIKSPCVLANMTVDYTPLGSYSTYADGSMVAYIINLQFQEMLPIYSSDYAPFAEGQSSVGSIGY